MVVVRQFLGVLCQPKFPCRNEIPERPFCGMTPHDAVGKSISAGLPAETFCSKTVLVPNGAMKAIRSRAARTKALRKTRAHFKDVHSDPTMQICPSLPNEIVRLLSKLSKRLQPFTCRFSRRRSEAVQQSCISGFLFHCALRLTNIRKYKRPYVGSLSARTRNL